MGQEWGKLPWELAESTTHKLHLVRALQGHGPKSRPQGLKALRCLHDFSRTLLQHAASTVRNLFLSSFVEGSLEVKLPTIWTDGKAEVGRVREEKRRREKIREERMKGKNMQVREKVGKSRFTMFFSPIGVLLLKLPPLPCAVLLASCILFTIIHICSSYFCNDLGLLLCITLLSPLQVARDTTAWRRIGEHEALTWLSITHMLAAPPELQFTGSLWIRQCGTECAFMHCV